MLFISVNYVWKMT